MLFLAMSAILAARGQVVSLAFSPDARMLAAAEVNGGIGANDQWSAPGGVVTTIRLRRVPDGAVLRELTGNTDLVWSVAFSPDGQQIASGGRDNTIRLWRVTDGAPLASWPAPTSHAEGAIKGVRAVAFSPDGQLLAAAGIDAVWVWRLSDRRLLATRAVNSGEVAFSPAGRMIATRSTAAIDLWDPREGLDVRRWSDPSVGLCRLTFSANGSLIASSERSGTIDLRHLPDGTVIRRLDGHPRGTWRVAFHPGGRLLFSGGTDGREGTGELEIPVAAVRVWRLDDGKLLAALPAGLGFVHSLSVSKDGRWVAAGTDNEIRLWPVTWN